LFLFQGDKCDRCKPMFVGDPIAGQECVPCLDFCNGNTDICMNKTNKDDINRQLGNPNRTTIMKWVCIPIFCTDSLET